jgi:hypothetical protein
MNNKKGQIIFIKFAFLLIIFIIIWALWLGKWINELGQEAITTNNLTGLEAFMLSNINLMIVFSIIVSIIVVAYIGVS